MVQILRFLCCKIGNFQVYEKISSHFDETRQKQWPNVTDFLSTIEPGGFLLDVGCGNGKYLIQQPGIFKVKRIFW